MDKYQHFRRTCCLLLQGRRVILDPSSHVFYPQGGCSRFLQNNTCVRLILFATFRTAGLISYVCFIKSFVCFLNSLLACHNQSIIHTTMETRIPPYQPHFWNGREAHNFFFVCRIYATVSGWTESGTQQPNQVRISVNSFVVCYCHSFHCIGGILFMIG